MIDALLSRKLDDLLAGQERAASRDAALLAKLGEVEDASRAVLVAVTRLAEPLGVMAEAIEKLTEAATQTKPKSDISVVLRAIEHKLGDLVHQTGRLANSVDALPDMMQETAATAAKMATSDATEPRPRQ